MKKILSGIFIVSAFSFFMYDNPQAKISNGIVSAGLYLPDAQNGYYRGQRFDWAGQVNSLQYKGHSFFGLWFEKYDPNLHDAIMGPVEAFDPIGYEDAAVGGRFVKIGVGALEKSDNKNNIFATP